MNACIVDASALDAAAVIVVLGLLTTSEQVVGLLVLCSNACMNE